MKKSYKVKFLTIIIILLILFNSVSIFIPNFNDSSRNRLKNAGYWTLTNTIYIDDTNPNFNWSKTAEDNFWCVGNGTWSNPYKIENVTIDGLFEGSCIFIENSDVPFIVKNCTLINIGRGALQLDSGIRLNNVDNGKILNNTCSFNEHKGIYFKDCSNLTISNNIVNNNGHVGIYVYTSNNNTIEDNEVSNNSPSIYIYESDNTRFIGNTISQPKFSTNDDIDRAIELTGYNNSFSGNIMDNCGIHLREEPLSKISTHKIDTTNLVNGKPLYYYVQKQFLNKDNFSNAGQVILVDCDHCEILSVNMSHGACGASLYYCNNITIFNSTITFQDYEGITLYYSHNNNISKNLISNIRTHQTIEFHFSDHNNISSNQLSGIDMHTSYWNTFRDNLISESNAGIYISSNLDIQNNNKFVNNTITNNSWYGIYLNSIRCKGNLFYLNKFIDNDANCRDEGQINYWDNGSIGNYWDDYGGNDINDDGIGDTPHIVPGSGGNQDNYPIWDDGHNGSIIIIDDSASNNWEWATQYSWCSGSGTKEDPYVITGANIDGKNSSSCIEIKNSNAYFIIKDSTTYNASSVDFPYYAGIKLVDTNNGLLLNNNCSNNNGHGIRLERNIVGCNNITIQECIINNNGKGYWLGRAGIVLDRSHNISIINNILNDNARGINTMNSNDNKIINNTIVNTWNDAIRLSQSNFNLVKKNYITDSYYGIMVNANNNTISCNDIYNSTNGIWFAGSNYNNTGCSNSIHDGSYGIYLGGAFCRYNLFYNNSLIGNGINAFDDGAFNDWDNGVIGNYWDNYTGMDVNDDGIGDNIYNITGLAGSQDNFPIWWDAPVFNIISPSLDDEFGNTTPSYEISITEGLKDTMWYTLDDGLTNTTFTSITGVINQILWWVVPLGDVLVRFYVNDSRGWISFQEVTVIKILEYCWILSNFIIDDTGGGDYTWAEAVVAGWCRGSGTLNNPFIIEFVKIDGQNFGSCLIIRNSTMYFRIKNCTFYNSGSDQHDAGIKLLDVSNGDLIDNNYSFNNANGIILDSCQYINITSNTVNNNTLSGIYLINCNNISILNNDETINNNFYGIFLFNSHYNNIIGNTINYNQIGIFLNQSNSNFIDWNNLMGNGKAIVDNGENNIIGVHNILPSKLPEFPFEILFIILIVGLVVIGAVVIVKKRISGKSNK